MRVLVTGATSMIGRETVLRLRIAGHTVTTFQRSPFDEAERTVQGSITDPDALSRAVDGQDAVIHLAAKVAPVGAWEDFEAINVRGTERLLEAAAAAGVSRFVYVSSPSVAHSGTSIIGGGADPADPEHTSGHYATSKAMAEVAALGASSEVMPVVAIRPHLVIGPGDTQLIGRVLERAEQGRLALVGSGLALIDATWVDNAADALVAALDRCPEVAGEAFVISNGEPRTVHELLSRITRAAGFDWSPRSVPRRVAIAGGTLVERLWERTGRDGEPPITGFAAEQLSTAHWFDQRRTREALRWEPQVTLAEGFVRLEEHFSATAKTTD